MFWNFSALHKTKTPELTCSALAGFGLVELMVSISILALISGVILVRQSSFDGAVLLRSEAYDMALQIREIQLNAVSASGDIQLNDFRSVLGIHLDTTVGNNQQYKIFRDDDSSGYNGFYDAGEAYGLQGVLDNSFEIRAVRAIGDTISGSNLSIIFVRPNFDARFFDGPGAEVNASSIEIDIARLGTTGSSNRDMRTIEISSTGQIAVQ